MSTILIMKQLTNSLQSWSHWPCSLNTAESFAEAWDRIGLHPVDIFVADISTIGVPLELLFEKANQNHVSVVLCGEAADMDDLQRAQELGAAATLLTSNVDQQLSRHLSEILANRNLQLVRDIVEQCPESESFTIELSNDKSLVPSICHLLVDESEKRGIHLNDDRFKVCIALEEAILNAIIHGNLEISSKLRERADDLYEQTIAHRRTSAEYRDRVVRITCRMSSHCMRVEIADQGPGFDVSSIPDPTQEENLTRPSGRGLLLMRAFMDNVTYNSTGNCVTLEKCGNYPNESDVPTAAMPLQNVECR